MPYSKIIADRRWWLTDDGHRVPDRHPRAKQLLVGKGCEIEQSKLDRHPVLIEPEAKAVSEPPENKAINGPWKKKRA